MVAANIEDPAGGTVIVSHGDCADDAAALEASIAEKCGAQDVIETRVGVIIGTHTGGGVLCAYFWGKSRTQ
jgi:fatty acid-binding protein DegV